MLQVRRCASPQPDPAAYAAYLRFFSAQIEARGVTATIERYALSDEANAGDRRFWLRTAAAGVAHPFIQLGHGLQFESELVVAEGLAMAAIHGNTRGGYFPDWDRRLEPASSGEGKLDIFGLLAELYRNDKLVPPPYDPDLNVNQRHQKIVDAGHVDELVKLCGRLDLDPQGDDAHFAERIHELMLFATLMSCATTRPGYEPRVDFFLFVERTRRR